MFLKNFELQLTFDDNLKQTLLEQIYSYIFSYSALLTINQIAYAFLMPLLYANIISKFLSKI